MRWLAASLLLAGCAISPAVPDVVRVPIPVPCLERLPDAPAMATDAELLALDDYRLVITLARDRASLKAAHDELRAAAAACVK